MTENKNELEEFKKKEIKDINWNIEYHKKRIIEYKNRLKLISGKNE